MLILAWVLPAVISACVPTHPSSTDVAIAQCGVAASELGEFVSVPSGVYTKGAQPLYADEAPTREIQVQGFWIQRHEVTNSQFSTFVEETGYVTDVEKDIANGRLGAGTAVFLHPDERSDAELPWTLSADATWKMPNGIGSSIDERMNEPVVHVSKRDADAYAAWVGARLPSEIEWEYAATLGLPDPENSSSGAYGKNGPRANTWQGMFPVANLILDGFDGAAPVGCFESDRLGLFDMIGNVWEWTDTPYSEGTHTMKGGSFLCADNFCRRYRPSARHPQDTDFSSSHIGFRVVRDEVTPDKNSPNRFAPNSGEL